VAFHEARDPHFGWELFSLPATASVLLTSVGVGGANSLTRIRSMSSTKRFSSKGTRVASFLKLSFKVWTGIWRPFAITASREVISLVHFPPEACRKSSV
jgi:hypothetical protein